MFKLLKDCPCMECLVYAICKDRMEKQCDLLYDYIFLNVMPQGPVSDDTNLPLKLNRLIELKKRVFPRNDSLEYVMDCSGNTLCIRTIYTLMIAAMDDSGSLSFGTL